VQLYYILYCDAMHTTLFCSILYCAIIFSSVLWCLLCEPYYTRAWHAILYCFIVYCTVLYGTTLPYCMVCLGLWYCTFNIKQYVQYCRAKHASSSIVWLTRKAPQHRRIQNDTIQYRATPQCSMAPQYSINTAPHSTVWQNTILKVWNQPVNIDI
jgi:hypothetical protein